MKRLQSFRVLRTPPSAITFPPRVWTKAKVITLPFTTCCNNNLFSKNLFYFYCAKNQWETSMSNEKNVVFKPPLEGRKSSHVQNKLAQALKEKSSKFICLMVYCFSLIVLHWFWCNLSKGIRVKQRFYTIIQNGKKSSIQMEEEDESHQTWENGRKSAHSA